MCSILRKCSPASRVLVLMVRSDLHNKKPYAVPVQCYLHAGLKEAHIRRLVTFLVQKMVQIRGEVASKLLHVHLYICSCYFDIVS